MKRRKDAFVGILSLYLDLVFFIASTPLSSKLEREGLLASLVIPGFP